MRQGQFLEHDRAITRPCSLRDSGSSATPWAMPARHPGRERLSGQGERSAAAQVRAENRRTTSERPEPTRPAARRSRPAGSRARRPRSAGPGQPLAGEDHRRVGAGICFGGDVSSSERPIIAWTSFLGVSLAAAAVRTSSRFLRTLTVSTSPSTSSRKWDTYTIVVPPRLRSRMISKSFSDSFAVSAAVGSSITINSASRARARRISTFCWSASGSIPAGTLPAARSPPARSTRRRRALSQRRSTTLSLCGSRARNTFSATLCFGTSTCPGRSS